MQSGSLNNILKENMERFKIPKSLHLPLKNIYYFLIRKLTGLKTCIKVADISTFPVNICSYDYAVSEQPVYKELNPTFVMVKEKKIDYQVSVNNLESKLKFSLPNILCMPQINNKIKWTSANYRPLSIVRDYPILLDVQLNDINAEELELSEPKVSNISFDEIKLDERVRIFEEIISMIPYIKQPKKSLLFKVPIVKVPLFKSYFTEEALDNFRESLAVQNKTKKSNVRISNVYDKFSIELFSSIKQEPASKNLVCYLNGNLSAFDKNKVYYLIIGQRKDNKITIKSLARLNKQ